MKSNLTLRVLTAIVGIPVVIFASIVGGLVFLLFVITASTLSLRELYKLTEMKGVRPLRNLGLCAGVLVNLSFFHKQFQHFFLNCLERYQIFIPFPSQSQLLMIIILLIVITAMLIELYRGNGSAIANISVTLFGVFYVSLFFGTLIGIRELFSPYDFPVYKFFQTEPNPSTTTNELIYRLGGYTIAAIFATIWISDSAAYFVGKYFGKRKLFERVSPKKTWEGTISGFIFALITGVVIKYFLLDFFSMQDAIVLGVIVGIFGQMGDLVESLLKRDAGIKDSSTLLPGHGGVLDRFDSLLFVAPIFYLYIDFIMFS